MPICRSKLVSFTIVIIISIVINTMFQLFFGHQQTRPAPVNTSDKTSDSVQLEKINANLLKQNQLNGQQSKQIYALEQRVMELSIRLKKLQDNINSASSLAEIQKKTRVDMLSESHRRQ
ncbi:hypothetical protein TDB9533_02942 [Thalassocella blandensis]|nr:hypothetical protein TDB9533_02942 [Thalassocella blandensis]